MQTWFLWIFNTSKNHNNNENHIVISQSASSKWMKMDKKEIKKIFVAVGKLKKIPIIKSPNKEVTYIFLNFSKFLFFCFETLNPFFIRIFFISVIVIDLLFIIIFRINYVKLI